VAASTILEMRNIADAVLRRTFATYVDVEGDKRSFNQDFAWPKQGANVAAYLGLKIC
jgi:hypothetical protein